MILRRYLRYLISKKETGEIVGLYRPEHIVCRISDDEEINPELKEMIAPLKVPAEYCSPELLIASLEGEEESLKRVLLWLDESLPLKETEREGWVIVPETYLKQEFIYLAHPDDYERIKRGGRRRITEIPEWQIFFGETTDDDVL